MVRLAVDPKNFERAVVLAKAVKAIGFEVAFNTMYMSNGVQSIRDSWIICQKSMELQICSVWLIHSAVLLLLK